MEGNLVYVVLDDSLRLYELTSDGRVDFEQPSAVYFFGDFKPTESTEIFPEVAFRKNRAAMSMDRISGSRVVARKVTVLTFDNVDNVADPDGSRGPDERFKVWENTTVHGKVALTDTAVLVFQTTPVMGGAPTVTFKAFDADTGELMLDENVKDVLPSGSFNDIRLVAPGLKNQIVLKTLGGPPRMPFRFENQQIVTVADTLPTAPYLANAQTYDFGIHDFRSLVREENVAVGCGLVVSIYAKDSGIQVVCKRLSDGTDLWEVPLRSSRYNIQRGGFHGDFLNVAIHPKAVVVACLGGIFLLDHDTGNTINVLRLAPQEVSGPQPHAFTQAQVHGNRLLVVKTPALTRFPRKVVKLELWL